jgi:pyruvate kinase
MEAPMRHTKIIATLGPASNSDEVVRDLLAGGVDVFRLNFSHGTHASHGEAIGRIRREAERAGRTVAILQDLSGPKIRTGRLEGGSPLRLSPGEELRIAVGDFPGGPGRISTTYADLAKAVRPGNTLLLDDGHLQLRVEEVDGQEIRTTVVDGGLLGERKGINAPGVALPASGLTAKDAVDLRFGVGAGVDLVAMSFVQTGADLRQLKDALRRLNAPAIPVVAKLERPEAVARLDEILRECDALMVARGDLGLELPFERVPRVQKEAVRRARALGVPVIIATQVFESMRSEPRPTRAEVSDAANAVDESVDAVMLAGETAAGNYPVRAVQTLDLVIREAESLRRPGVGLLEGSALLPAHGRALCEAAVTLAGHSDAAAIIAITRGGKTARVLSALRPRVPIFAATSRPEVARRLALCRSVAPVVAELDGDAATSGGRVAATLVADGRLDAGATVVIASVTPDLSATVSNVLRIQIAHPI